MDCAVVPDAEGALDCVADWAAGGFLQERTPEQATATMSKRLVRFTLPTVYSPTVQLAHFRGFSAAEKGLFEHARAAGGGDLAGVAVDIQK